MFTHLARFWSATKAVVVHNAAVDQDDVAFEVDSDDPCGRWGWSVLVQGSGTEIPAPEEFETLSRLPLKARAYGDSQPGRYLGIEVGRVSDAALAGRPTGPR